MPATLIPEANLERLFEPEETGETNELMALANNFLEDAELKEEYSIGYISDNKKTSEHSGSYYTSHEVSPFYDGPEPDINVPLESDVQEFYGNLNGEFRVVDSDGENRTYKLVMSCDDGILLKGEVGFGERDITDFRYTRGNEDSYNQLQVYLDGNWCRFGQAEEIGEGNETMKHIELIESVYKQLKDARSAEEHGWEIVYSPSLEVRLGDLPEDIESTVDSKASSFEQNLNLGVKPESILSAMSHPWKPLLEMRLGSDYRAMFIASSNLQEEDIAERFQGEKKLIGLSVESKKDFKEKFRSEGGNQINSAIDYSLDHL